VINNTTVNRVSYNGGPGGTAARATPQEEAAARERHVPPVQAQEEHVQQARNDQQLRASVNQGKPPIAATDKPTNFRGNGVVAAQEAGAPYHPPANRAEAQPNRNAPPQNAPTHASEVQPHQYAPPNTGNAKQDQEYQRQEQQLYQQQQQEHQQMAQQQEREHQQAQQQQANQQRMQQMEQQHAQQTQQMEARHEQQMQQMQQHQAPSTAHSQPGHPPKQ
jgi:hypothetical protein